MKPKSSCELCRSRHRKCVTRLGAARCNGCEEAGRECRVSARFQFRAGRKGRGTADAVGGNTREFGSFSRQNESLTKAAQGEPLSLSPRSPMVGPPSTPYRRTRRQSSDDQPLHLTTCEDDPWQRHDYGMSNAGANPDSPTLSRRSNNQDTPNASTESPTNIRSSKSPVFTKREAFLFRLWVQRLSLSVRAPAPSTNMTDLS